MNDKQIITEAARKYGVSPKLLWGLYGTETSFGKNVSRSSAGAVGPFQFLPSTARGMGVNPYNFKSAAYGAARYLSQYKTRGTAGMLSAYNAGPGGGIQRSYVNTTLRNAQSYGNVPGAKIPGIEHTPSGNAVGPSAVAKLPGVSFDQAGFQKAQKGAILGKLISETEGGAAKDNPLFATGLVSTRLPQRSEYENLPAPKGQLLKTPGASVYVPPNSDTTKLKGVAHFGDKQVAMWIAPILKYAKEHGWKGSVTSGFRSNAEQTRIYNSGVRPAAKPGTSNHEGTEFPRGAVDVTDADALAKILARSPYRGRLVWAGAKDPVHFSHPRGGRY